MTQPTDPITLYNEDTPLVPVRPVAERLMRFAATLRHGLPIAADQLDEIVDWMIAGSVPRNVLDPTKEIHRAR